jgi:hypothetical protein
MPTPACIVRHTAAALMICGLIVNLLPGFTAGQDELPRETATPESSSR